MWLVNERLGVAVLLAEYAPSTGWYVRLEEGGRDLKNELDAAFDGDTSFGEHLLQGPTDWRLVYGSAPIGAVPADEHAFGPAPQS